MTDWVQWSLAKPAPGLTEIQAHVKQHVAAAPAALAEANRMIEKLEADVDEGDKCCAANAAEITRLRGELREYTAQLGTRDDMLDMRARENELLREEIARLREAIDWFCRRAENGEVHSTKTYARFKLLLARNNPAPKE